MMKKITNIIMSSLLIISLLLNAVGTVKAKADTSGTHIFGTNLYWGFDLNTGTLTISGTGTMQETETQPWESIKSDINVVVIESGVASIGNHAFEGCSQLSEIVIPDSLKSIGQWAFAGVKNMKSISIPSAVTDIKRFAFEHCSGLEEINVDPQNLVYSSEDGVLFNKDKTILLRYPQAKAGDYSVPGSVTLIDRDSFEYCNKLTDIDISDDTEISDADGDYNVFYGCTGLADEDGFVILRDVLYQYTDNCMELVIPDGIKAIGFAAISNCSDLEKITIPNSLGYIGLHAFFGDSLRNLSAVYYNGS